MSERIRSASWSGSIVWSTLVLLCGGGVLTAEIRLQDVTDQWGLDFRHHHGGAGQRFIVETMGTGLVMFDFDGDGDEDLFFIDGTAMDGYQGERPQSRLYRNDGGGRFIDFTRRSGIEPRGYMQGGCVGDVDGDGEVDLHLTALGANELWHNNGNGTFSDVTPAAGVANPLWGSSCAFADVDRDDDLDLYVGNYVAFTIDTHRPCITQRRQVYCHPGQYGGVPDVFYRNRGDGTFEEYTRQAGLMTAEPRAALGIAFGDLDNDGWPDLYVANDAEPNHLFRNRGDGTFEDVALLAGTAYSDQGRPEAGMGVDLGDVDGDGLLDVFVTNFELETNALYRNLGGSIFTDSRYALNIAESSLLNLAFGVAFADLDHDADLDLAIANGHILDNARELHESSRYAQRNQVLENNGKGRFEERVDVGMEAVRVSRGLVTGDLDGDGDLDVAILNSNDRAEVYANRSDTSARHWLKVDLVSSGANTLGIGARLEITSGGSHQIRERRTASSYLSQNAVTVHLGLAAAPRVDNLSVYWPSGKRQRFAALPADRRISISE